MRAARSLIFLKDAEGRNLDVLRAAGAQSRLYNQRRCCVGFCFSQVGPEGISGELPGRAPAALSLARSLAHSLTRSGRLDSLLEGAQLHLLGRVGGVVILPAGEEDNTFFFVSGKASNALLGIRSSMGLMSARRGEGKKIKNKNASLLLCERF